MPTPPEPTAGDDAAITAGRPPRGTADAELADGATRSDSAQTGGVCGIHALSMDTLREFQKALRRGLKTVPCELHPSLCLHVDYPENTPRLTYAKVERGRVKALAVFVAVQAIEGEQCYHVGYAVDVGCRGRGFAAQILQQGIDELRNGLRRNGVKRFYVEAIVSQANLPSQRVAAKVISATPKSGTDDNTGEPIFAYTRLVECSA